MKRPRHYIGNLIVTGLVIVAGVIAAGCRETAGEPNPTLAPTAGASQPAGSSSSSDVPPTFTPGAPPAPAEGADAAAAPPTAPPVADEDDAAIDAAVDEINDELCREAHQARAEIAALLAQGQDVADLESAVVELIEELDGCSLDRPPPP